MKQYKPKKYVKYLYWEDLGDNQFIRYEVGEDFGIGICINTRSLFFASAPMSANIIGHYVDFTSKENPLDRADDFLESVLHPNFILLSKVESKKYIILK